MALSQRERSKNNPLNLGTFSQTSLRLLTGSLGPKSEIIQGGYGNDTYNHWFQVNLNSPAWIIAIKAGSILSTESLDPATNGSRLEKSRFQIAFYDQNKTPIQQQYINEYNTNYWRYVANSQSDLYNTTGEVGDERFLFLGKGSYLLCISAVRNEAMKYAVGLVMQFPSVGNNVLITEDSSQTPIIQETVEDENLILLDSTEEWDITEQESNLVDWQVAWARENPGPFPAFFAEYAI